MPRILFLLPLLFLAACQERDPWQDDASIPASISFNQHIRPLLLRECLQCHDSGRSEGGLRLDLRSGVSSVVTDNSPAKSRLWEVIAQNHPAPLPDREKALLWRWIRQGTPTEGHWASLPLKNVSPPIAGLSPAGEVDDLEFAFLSDALLGTQLSPDQSTDWTTLRTRRVDLIEALMGEPGFAQTFRARLMLLSGTRPVPEETPFDPYFRWVESEIAAPDFSLRNFFRNSLAGDLIPDAGEQGAIATAWTRLPSRADFPTLSHRVAQSFLALDLSRTPQPSDLWTDAATTLPLFLPTDARPFRSRLPIPPFLPLHTPRQSSALLATLSEEELLWRQAREVPDEADRFFQSWLAEVNPAPTIPDLLSALSFDDELTSDSSLTGRARVTSRANLLPGVQGTGIAAPATFSKLPLSSSRPFTFSFFLSVPELSKGLTPILSAETAEGAPVGFRFSLSSNGTVIQLLNGSDENSLSAVATILPTPGHWHHFAITYDGSRSATGLNLWIDSVAVALSVTNDELYGIAQSSQGSLQFAPGYESVAPAALDELQIYGRSLTELEVAHLRDGTSLFAAIRDEFPREDLLFRYYLSSQYEPFRQKLQAATEATSRVGMLQDSALLVPIARQGELPAVRPTLPFRPLPMSSEANRLGLADWLFHPRNPVTPRVMVSRLYQAIYGIALLPSGSDLSDPWRLPPNSQLLEFLAGELLRNDWELRAILKVILLNPPPTVSSV